MILSSCASLASTESIEPPLRYRELYFISYDSDQLPSGLGVPIGHPRFTG